MPGKFGSGEMSKSEPDGGAHRTNRLLHQSVSVTSSVGVGTAVSNGASTPSFMWRRCRCRIQSLPALALDDGIEPERADDRQHVHQSLINPLQRVGFKIGAMTACIRVGPRIKKVQLALAGWSNTSRTGCKAVVRISRAAGAAGRSEPTCRPRLPGND